MTYMLLLITKTTKGANVLSDGNMRVMIVSSCELEEILVLKFVIPVACTYGEPLCNEVGA